MSSIFKSNGKNEDVSIHKQPNELMQKMFPSELEKRTEFNDFVNHKYPEMQRNMIKSEIAIVEANPKDRNDNDYMLMTKLFKRYEIFQNHEQMFYKDLTDACEVMSMMKGDIFILINVYIIKAGIVMIKSQKDRSILG